LFPGPGLALVLAAVLATQPPSLPPSHLTLKGNLPLSVALQEMQKQTGNALVDLRPRLGQDAPDPMLTLQIDRLPFWEALDRVAQQANLRVFPFVDARAKRISVGLRAPEPSAEKQMSSVAYSGPFRIAVTRVAAVRDLEHPTLSKLAVTLQLACESRFEPLMLLANREAVHVRMGQADVQAVEQTGLDKLKLLGEPAVELTLRLPLPARTLEKLPELRGDFVALVHPGRITAEFEKLAAGERREQEGVVVTLQRLDVERRQQRSFVHMMVAYPAGQMDLESHQTWTAEGHELVLRSKSGSRELRPTGNPVISVEEGGRTRVTYTMNEPLIDPADWRLEYRVPKTPIRVPVRFSLIDLTLP
jgi:hypothetical protein